MKRSKLIAISAILSALSVALLFLGSVSQILDLSCAALASIVVVFAVIELKGIWPYLIYAVTSILSLLLLSDKFSGVVYLLFAGYYPMLKRLFEAKFPRVIEWAMKLLLFNAMLTAILAVSKFILKLPDDEIPWNIVAYAICNPVFILYDIALTRLITLYFTKLRKRFKFK